MKRALQTATFLDEVPTPMEAPIQPTPFLLHNAEYRRLLDDWRHLQAGLRVRLEAAELETSLLSVPNVFELWCGLATLRIAAEHLVDQGFKVRRQTLVRWLERGPLVKLAKKGTVLLNASNAEGTRVEICFEPTFTMNGTDLLASRSYDQRPDIVFKIERPDGRVHLLLFDPKYKLEERRGKPAPKKEDIDKMHTYRDAIIHRDLGRVVRHAAILYPGPTTTFGGDTVSALNADPLNPNVLHQDLATCLDKVLG